MCELCLLLHRNISNFIYITTWLKIFRKSLQLYNNFYVVFILEEFVRKVENIFTNLLIHNPRNPAHWRGIFIYRPKKWSFISHPLKTAQYWQRKGDRSLIDALRITQVLLFWQALGLSFMAGNMLWLLLWWVRKLQWSLWPYRCEREALHTPFSLHIFCNQPSAEEH